MDPDDDDEDEEDFPTMRSKSLTYQRSAAYGLHVPHANREPGRCE